ncbi:MAG: heparinase II/III family protein [Tsuneonella sp.]
MIRWLDRRFPRLAFGRRVPPGRIFNRLRRRVEHRIGAGRGGGMPDARLRPVASWPRTLFAPRRHVVARDADGWTFAFLSIEQRFGPTIDWRPEGGAIGQLWRMNLHYFEYLEALGARDGAEAIRQWIAANPPDASRVREDAWNSYALSIRVVCWLQWLARLEANDEAFDLPMIERSLALQLVYLARFPETDIGGNHLVKNAKALAWGAACFEGPAADWWRSRAAALLRAELGTQVLADGFHFERSPSYHCQVTADLIETAEADDALGVELAPQLGRMVSAACAMTHPDGLVAQFNDAGLHMAYPAVALSAALEALGFVHREPAPCTILREAGLASLRSEGLSTFMKFGAPGPGVLPAHAHGDIGTFELSAGAHRVIVDQGVFEYVPGARRDSSRAAASHNLSAPVNRDMADFFGAFRCGWMPAPASSAASDADAMTVEVGHDGFAAASGDPVVRRKLRATGKQVRIDDRLTGGRVERFASGRWATRFLLHPGWQALQERGEWRLLGPDGLAVRLQCDAAGLVEPAEWWPDMGTSIATTRLVFPWEGARDAIAVTIELD